MSKSHFALCSTNWILEHHNKLAVYNSLFTLRGLGLTEDELSSFLQVTFDSVMSDKRINLPF